MSNETTGAPDPRPSDAAGTPQYRSTDHRSESTDQNTWFFGAQDRGPQQSAAQQHPFPAPHADHDPSGDVPELDENDPLLRHGGPGYGAAEPEQHG
ncbi:hypothetical protein, partial [Staphylococcus aureus]|uniref:hypothetical protein n=1 Tax=Staphylococcus aureus TaxID=1280 RepID=UPI0013FE49DE